MRIEFDRHIPISILFVIFSQKFLGMYSLFVSFYSVFLIFCVPSTLALLILFSISFYRSACRIWCVYFFVKCFLLLLLCMWSVCIYCRRFRLQYALHRCGKRSCCIQINVGFFSGKWMFLCYFFFFFSYISFLIIITAFQFSGWWFRIPFVNFSYAWYFFSRLLLIFFFFCIFPIEMLDTKKNKKKVK